MDTQITVEIAGKAGVAEAILDTLRCGDNVSVFPTKYRLTAANPQKVIRPWSPKFLRSLWNRKIEANAQISRRQAEG